MEDKDFYGTCLKIFIDSLDKSITEMSLELDSKNTQPFIILTHTLKSNLNTLGANELGQLAQKIETAAKNDDLAFCEQQFPVFMERLSRLKEEIVTFLHH